MDAKPVRRLKILFVTGKLTLGGLETHIYDLCRGLQSRGHEVSLHAPYVDGALRHRLEAAAVKLVAQPESCNFDIVHAHPWTWGLLRGLELSVLMNKPLVVTFHGRYRVAWAELARHRPRIITVSPEVQRYLGEGVVIENGIDTTWFAPTELKFPGGPITLSFVGRLDGERWRAIRLLADVADRLGLCLRVAGDHTSLQSTEILGRERIVWHGALTDIRSVLRSSHVVFSTGRGIREAMASGRPAVVLNSTEYDGLVTPDNVEKLRSSNFSGRATRREPNVDQVISDISNLVRDRAYWESLAHWGYYYSKQHFGLEVMIAKHEQLYLECLENRENEQACGRGDGVSSDLSAGSAHRKC